MQQHTLPASQPTEPTPQPTTPWENPPQAPPRGPTYWPAGPNTDLRRLTEMLAETPDLIAGARETVTEVAAASRRFRRVMAAEPVSLPPHLPGLLPVTDPALRGAA